MPISEYVPKRGRSSTTRYNTGPEIREIPDEAYENPYDLLLAMYGNKIISETIIGTNEKIEKLHGTESEFYPVSESDIEEIFGILLIMSQYKCANEHMRDFLDRLRTYPESFGFKGFQIMGRIKFEFIYANLDIGTTKKVPNEKDPLRRPIIDLKSKYTIAQKVGNRADRTAYLKKTCTYMFDVIILNVYAFYRIHYLKTNPERKTLPKKFHRNFQLDLAKNLLRKSAPKPPLTELHNPLLGIDLEKENRSPTPIRRAVCHYCVKGNKMRTRNKCHRCRKFICKSHSQTLHLCTDCPTRK